MSIGNILAQERVQGEAAGSNSRRLDPLDLLSDIIRQIWPLVSIESQRNVLLRLTNEEIFELARHLEPQEVENLLRLIRSMESCRDWMGRSLQIEKLIKENFD